MGICSNVTLIGSLLIVTGLLSTGSIISGGISIVKHFNDYKCGDLNYGILVGLISTTIFIVNLLLYTISCVKKSSLVIPSICIIGSLVYNIYLTNKIGDSCETHYNLENKPLWNFYIYYLLSLIGLIVLMGIILIYNCCKKK